MKPDELTLTVAASNGKPQRLAEARYFADVFRDTVNPDSHRSRGGFIKAMLKQFRVHDVYDDRWLHSLLQDKGDEADEAASAAAAEQLRKPAKDALEGTPSEVIDEAGRMLADPYLLTRILDDIRVLGVAGEVELAMTTYLAGTSRLLSKPLAVIVQGPSASGKSFVIENVARLFPEESVLHATQMTPQALFHLKPGSLRHRFVVAGERSRRENDDTADTTRALREILSTGKLVKLMPVKVADGIVTQQIEQEGPISYVESTTLSRIFEEDANRCLIVNTDDRHQQTQQVVKMIAGGGAGREEVTATIQRHHTLQRLLKPMEIVVPFAERLAAVFPTERIEARRAFPQTLATIKTVALLHQGQRECDSDGAIIATADDYRHAYQFLRRPIARSIGQGISDGAARYFDRLQEWAGAEVFSSREAVKHDRASKRSIYSWLSELADAGAIEQVEPHRGQRPATWRMTGDSPDFCDALPSVETIFRE